MPETPIPQDLTPVADGLGGINRAVADYYGVHRDTSRKWLKKIKYKYNPSAGPISTDRNLDKVLREIHDQYAS